MSEKGGHVRQFTDNPEFPILDAQWSPDGRQIAVVSLVGDSLTYPGFRRTIFVMDADGRGRYQLTDQWAYVEDSSRGRLEYGGAENPVWSPDSKRIAYTRLMVPDKFGNHDIFMIKKDKTNERRITSTIDTTERVTDWAKDGTSLLGDAFDYTRTDSLGRLVANSSIVVFDFQGNYLHSFGKTGITFSLPIWSQKDEVIAFNSNNQHSQDIYMMEASDDNKIKLTEGVYQFTFPVSWSPDNTSILFNAGNGDKMGRPFGKIFSVNINTEEIKEITPFQNSAYSYATSWRR